MSGEWTYGAANFLKIVASDSSYPSDVKKKLLAEVLAPAKCLSGRMMDAPAVGCGGCLPLPSRRISW